MGVSRHPEVPRHPEVSRHPGVSRSLHVAVTLILLVVGWSSGLAAQNAWPGEGSRAAAAFSRTNLVLASFVFVPLILIDPLEGIDERLSPETVGSAGAIRHFGRALGNSFVGLALTGGTALVGAWIDNDDVTQIGVVSLKALAAAEAAALMLKVAVGRSRPYVASDPGQFRPMVFDHDRLSFPSGHTAKAFSMATVLTRRFASSHRWVPYLTYGLATTTAVSRVLERKHWATDVVAGAAVGILAGRLVGVAPRSEEAGAGPRVSLVPTFGEGVGLSLTLGVN